MKILAFTFFLMLMMTEIFCAQTPPPIETGVSQSLAKWRAANYSDVRYKLNITLEKGAPLMKGEIEIRVNLTEEGAKNDLILDWRTTQFANDKDKPWADVYVVNQFKIDVLGSAQKTEKEHLIIPQKLLKTGENIIKINFTSPIKTSGAAVTRYVDKEDGAEYVYSLFVPSDASTAFPVFDQPDLKARFTLEITTPINWKVTSNGWKFCTNENAVMPPKTVEGFKKNQQKEIDEKKKKYPYFDYEAEECGLKIPAIGKTYTVFRETKPISTYVFAFAAGDFTTFEDEEYLSNSYKTQIYVRKSQAEKFKAHEKEVFRLNREGVKFLEDWFDYKFPFPKYDLVLIPEFPFGGMEHAGATFLREDRVIFPTEPTKNDYITRANVIFHEAAHQWFGDTVTMKWFDDLWLKEGFAEFMAYKTLEKVLPEYNAWKVFYERNKQAAYLTDVTRGTTPIYQEIPNLASAKSAYGNIVYRKAPSFLRQAEFLFGEDKFQIAVRAFLKKHEFANATWQDLVNEFQKVSGYDLVYWGNDWVKKRGVPIIKIDNNVITQENSIGEKTGWSQKFKIYTFEKNPNPQYKDAILIDQVLLDKFSQPIKLSPKATFIFPNYQDYGYGIFLLDEKSRAYVLANIQTEKDDFLRSMMWGSLWDSVRFYELAPEVYVDLVIKNFSSELRLQARKETAKITPKGVTLNIETDESTIQTLLGRVSTAMNYYIADNDDPKSKIQNLKSKIETVLLERIANAETMGQRITFYRAFLNLASSENARKILKEILAGKSKVARFELRPKDKFDIVTRLIVLGDKDALNILANLEKQYTDDASKRYAYAAKAGIPTAENKLKYWKDFTENKEISESWIESAFAVWNTSRHSDLTLPYLQKALAELPNLKKNRKIFFVNGWLSAFIGGQKSEQALNIVNKFLADNPNLDKDLRLKILENADNLERAVKIREKYGK